MKGKKKVKLENEKHFYIASQHFSHSLFFFRFHNYNIHIHFHSSNAKKRIKLPALLCGRSRDGWEKSAELSKYSICKLTTTRLNSRIQ